ncbi:type IV pilus modification protein PilV [Thiobacter aerophilum]|uniref:Type IV pilus modification protein PilV n=1 Tax=Thiobacter aerophilum TaxID=3121275 RepID=A0ABV0EHB1_9BURK
MKDRAGGFTLLEALITVLVISLGLLGLAGALTVSMQNNASSVLRTKAVAFAYDIGDRIRANMAGFTTGAYSNLTGVPSNPGCVATGCTPAQMAQYDYWAWRDDLASALPNGTGVVCIDSTPEDGSPDAPACDGVGESLAVKVWWTDDKSGQPKFFSALVRP